MNLAQTAADALYKTAWPTSVHLKSEAGIAGVPAVCSSRTPSHGPVTVRALTDGKRGRGGGPALVPGPASIHHLGLTGGHYRGCPSLTLLCTAGDWWITSTLSGLSAYESALTYDLQTMSSFAGPLKAAAFFSSPLSLYTADDVSERRWKFCLFFVKCKLCSTKIWQCFKITEHMYKKKAACFRAE